VNHPPECPWLTSPAALVVPNACQHVALTEEKGPGLATLRAGSFVFVAPVGGLEGAPALTLQAQGVGQAFMPFINRSAGYAT